MKITFLGTSHGFAEKNRNCQSILIETGADNAYLFDIGAPVATILRDIEFDFKRIKSIFVSHLHGDHMNGLMDVLRGAYYLDLNNLKVYLPEQRGIDACEVYFAMTSFKWGRDRFSYELVREGEFYVDDSIRVTAIHTDHMDNTTNVSYGFLIEAEGKKVYITGDLHRTLKDFPMFLYEKRVDFVVTECAHFSAEELFERLPKCKCEKLAIIHVYPFDKYVEFERLKNKVDFEVLTPNDLDFIEV